MNRRFALFVRRGLTLIELVVVMAIIAVLAMMVIPRLDFLRTQAEHASSAGTQADLGTMIQTYKSSSNPPVYPALDTLIGSGGSGLHTKLQAQTAGAFLEPWTVPGPSSGQSWYRSLTGAGFQYGFRHNDSATDASASGTSLVNIASEASSGSLTLAAIKSGSSGLDMSGLGMSIRRAIYPGGATYIPATDPDGIPNNGDETAASTVETGVGEIPSDRKLVVFGVGPRSDLVGKVLASAPLSTMDTDDPKTTYCRYLVVFEVYSNGNKPAQLKLVTDHRGRQIQARVDLYKTTSPNQ